MVTQDGNSLVGLVTVDGQVAGPGGPTTAGDVSYTGILPSLATTVEGELDHRARNLGGIAILNSLADLEAAFPNVAGVYNINRRAKVTGTVVLPAGHSIFQTGGGEVEGSLGSSSTVVGNVAGPLWVGQPAQLQGLGLHNLNAGGSHLSVTSPAGQLVVLRRVVCSGPCPVGTISNVTGFVTVEGCQWDGVTDGLSYTGTVVAARHRDCTGSNLGSTVSMFNLASGLTAVVGMEFQGCTLVSNNAGQSLVYVDPAATLPTTALPTTVVGVRLTNNAVVAAGAIGTILAAAGVQASSIKVYAKNNLYGLDSLILGVASFLNSAAPLAKTYAGTGQEAIPWSNGAGTNMVLSASSQRFTLVTGPGATDWYLRYDGPILYAELGVEASVSYEANSTASNLTWTVQSRMGTGGVWADMPGSTVLVRQTNGDPRAVNLTATIAASPDAHFRIVVANSNASASTNIRAVSIQVQV